MGLLGIAKGVFKMGKGVIEGDAEEIILGAKKNGDKHSNFCWTCYCRRTFGKSSY